MAARAQCAACSINDMLVMGQDVVLLSACSCRIMKPFLALELAKNSDVRILPADWCMGWYPVVAPVRLRQFGYQAAS